MYTSARVNPIPSMRLRQQLAGPTDRTARPAGLPVSPRALSHEHATRRSAAPGRPNTNPVVRLGGEFAPRWHGGRGRSATSANGGYRRRRDAPIRRAGKRAGRRVHGTLPGDELEPRCANAHAIGAGQIPRYYLTQRMRPHATTQSAAANPCQGRDSRFTALAAAVGRVAPVRDNPRATVAVRRSERVVRRDGARRGESVCGALLGQMEARRALSRRGRR